MFKVIYTKLFVSGNLKGLIVECSISAPDLDHASRYVGELGCSSKIHLDLFTKDEYHVLTPRIELNNISNAQY